MTRIPRPPDGSITPHTEVAVHLPAGASMLEAEDHLMAAVNQSGAGLTSGLPESMDASGQPLILQDGVSPTAKRTRENATSKLHTAVWWWSVGPVNPAREESAITPRDQTAGLIGAAEPKLAQVPAAK